MNCLLGEIASLPPCADLLPVCFSRMTRARWMIAGSWLLLFWLLAGTVWVPTMQRTLAERAAALLATAETGHGRVQVRFDGLHAHLTGRVRHAVQAHALSSALRSQVRATTALAGPFGTRLNPVSGVTNSLEITPYAPGWLLIAANGAHAQLIGAAATDYEARDLAALVVERWNGSGGRMEPRLHVRADLHDDAPDPARTLSQVPSANLGGGGDSAQIQIARIGGDWQRLVVDAQDSVLQEKTDSLGISEADWTDHVLPALQIVRKYQAREREKSAEAERQSRLPPPHVFLAAREQRLLLRGEVATLGMKRELLNTCIAAFPGWRVIDDLRVNHLRREVAEFGPVTTALLPVAKEGQGSKSLMLGLSGAAWQQVDWQVDGQARPWQEMLPADLPPTLLQDDSRMVTEWLQGSARGIPTLPMAAQPSFLTLILLPDKVILAGQLAEEALRTQLIEAARQTYAGRAVLLAEALLARGTCAPTAEVQQTARSFPPLPAAGQPPVIAFARPGQTWKSSPATPAHLSPGALPQTGILPSDFPAAMAEDTLAEGYDHLRHYWQKQSAETKTPAQR